MLSRNTASYWLARFVLGIALLMLAGLGRIGPMFGAMQGLATVALGAWGFLLALSAVSPLVRFATLQSRQRAAWTEAATVAFARASLPRRIYYLLAAVAEVDGTMSAAERETVRHFLLERFEDPVQNEELRSWELQPLQVTDRIGLAARIAANLDPSEVDSLFCWCCLVAFADGKYAEREHLALQEVAKGLGLPPARARQLFHLARSQHMRGDQRRETAGPTRKVDSRAQAFVTLGLPPDATMEQIRRRHRELVRRFHPDTQPNLGPVAQREATERFTAIQRAYETLTS